MKRFLNFNAFLMAAMIWFIAGGVLWPVESHAVMKCQELLADRYCTDGAARPYTFGPGQTTMVPAPVLAGFNSPCWNWNRQFQCIETDPIYQCESGTDFNQVKNQCSLTAATVRSTVKINAFTYITDAVYTYRCSFGEFETDETLPEKKECVLLESTITDTGFAPAAPDGADPAPPTGGGTTPLDSSIVTDQHKLDNYVCYSDPVTICSDTCYEQVVDPDTGNIQQLEVACESPVTNCVSSSDQCKGTIIGDSDDDYVSGQFVLGPDGRCISSDETFVCQNGPIPRCLTEDNCTLQSTTPTAIQDNGVALGEEQTYICTNTTTSCTKITEVSNCVHIGAWGWDKMQLKSEMGGGLGEYNQAMSQLDAIQKGMNQDDIYIFSGQDLRCHYAIGNFLNTAIMIALVVATMVFTGGASTGLLASALQSGGMAMGTANAIGAAVSIGSAAVSDAPNSKALGSNCCKDYVIEGSEAWYKLGSCSADEVKLSVARVKGLYEYIGEYCSKKSGFPIRQCVEKTRTFCVFDDMLALVVNKQGRAQLDSIASSDPTTAKSTAEISFQLFGSLVADAPKYSGVLNTGKWVPLATQSNSQIWTWQYPGYCKSQMDQTAAYALFESEINTVLDSKGIQPGTMTPEQAFSMLLNIVEVKPFQECAETPGIVPYMTCSKTDDSCDVNKLPEGPSAFESDLYGEDISDADVNWRVQNVRGNYLPGDYGVTATMATDSSFAAVSSSVNEFITSVGSCQVNGSCLYKFIVNDKLSTNGLGAKKRITEHAQFPLYTVVQNSAWPSITYLDSVGNLAPGGYQADPNRGLGDPTVVSTQRFLFHPNYLTTAPDGNIHSHVLMEWAYTAFDKTRPADDYTPLLVPTNLPEATAGWAPYGNTGDNRQHFYLSGGCEPNSRWCNYKIEVNLNVPRHPWGSPKAPRCWGFTLEQMAALDFDRMDLSQWLNSLDLGAASNGLSADASTAMTEQVLNSAQSAYTAYSTGAAVNLPMPGSIALVTNTDIVPMLSEESFKAYVVKAAVPSNWPQYFDKAENVNPVSNVTVDWGDGRSEIMPAHSGGRAFYAEHDYGDRKVGTYKITVTLDTEHNGTQVMTTHVRVTPNRGQQAKTADELDFTNRGIAGQTPGEYIPSNTQDGTNIAPANLDQLSPGTVEQFDAQGEEINR